MLGLLIMVCSILGLPWFVAATVRSVTHVRSLLKESEVKIPGEKTQIVGARCVASPVLCIQVSCQLNEVLNAILARVASLSAREISEPLNE